MLFTRTFFSGYKKCYVLKVLPGVIHEGLLSLIRTFWVYSGAVLYLYTRSILHWASTLFWPLAACGLFPSNVVTLWAYITSMIGSTVLHVVKNYRHVTNPQRSQKLVLRYLGPQKTDHSRCFLLLPTDTQSHLTTNLLLLPQPSAIHSLSVFRANTLICLSLSLLLYYFKDFAHLPILNGRMSWRLLLTLMKKITKENFNKFFWSFHGVRLTILAIM